MKILITDDSNNWVNYHLTCLKSFLPEDTIFETANWAKEGLEKITLNIDEPYDILPLYAGEWFVKQIKTYKEYSNTKIIIASAAPDISKIAEKYEVNYIPKRMCQFIESYKKLFE